MVLETQDGKPDLRRGIVKRLLQISVSTLAQAAALFTASGRLGWVMAWAYVAVIVAIPVINTPIVLRKNPDLIAERAQVKDTRVWDKVIILCVTLLLYVTLIVAGLDVRFGWSPLIALPIQLLALVFVVVGYGLLSWALVTNKFFSGVARIQKERGHTVVSEGPYRYMRHPGYLGMIMALLAMPFLLGSLWALIPAELATNGYVARTALEDRMLREELVGYKDYARRVRYRLLPGVW